MADVRALLRKERADRRVSHPQATYSTKGALICIVCNIQLKSDSLWAGHLRSTQHAMRAQRMKDTQTPLAESTTVTQAGEIDSNDTPATPLRNSNANGKKRSRDDSPEDARKKSRPGVPEGFFDSGFEQSSTDSTSDVPSGQEIQLVSRPATPLKTTPVLESIPKLPSVDEDEWAAFEADIAAAEVEDALVSENAVISAPAISATELAAKAREEESAQRKERQEAEMEGDKEDAARKLEEEFDEMKELETRLQKLKEKREALRIQETASVPMPITEEARKEEEEDEEGEDESDEEDDDGWGGFRMR